jgi:hypothetical protein
MYTRVAAWATSATPLPMWGVEGSEMDLLPDMVTDLRDNVALWPFSPNHVGTFATLGQGDQTACAKCQQGQADRTQVTGQIPLTLALTERYLAQSYLI